MARDRSKDTSSEIIGDQYAADCGEVNRDSLPVAAREYGHEVRHTALTVPNVLRRPAS